MAFVDDPSNTLFDEKIGGRPLPLNADPRRYPRAEDLNDLRTAALELRDQTAGSVNVLIKGAAGDGVEDDAQAFVDANAAAGAASSEIYAPGGTFKIDSDPPLGLAPIQFSGGARFVDANTGEKFYPGAFTGRRPRTRQAWRDREDRAVRTLAPKVLCYGDSNTRYYQGDTSTPGPFSKSYPAQLDVLMSEFPALWQASVINRGFPGEDAQYGIDNWTDNVAAYSPEVVVYGFGTNDIKVAGADLEAYIGRMNTLVVRALDAGISPMVLGIPWFYENYGSDDLLSQQRIPVWNNRLKTLCDEYRIAYIDTYTPFKDVPSAFFNESVAMRHYNDRATRFIAHQIARVLLSQVTTLGTETERPAIFRDRFSLPLMPEAKAGDPRAAFTQTVGGRRFQTLRIQAGQSITLGGAGRWMVGFFPNVSGVGTITVGASTTNVTVDPVTDAGEVYPIQRYSGSLTLMGTGYDLVIACSSGTLYVRCYGFEEQPAPAVAGTDGHMPSVASSALPASPTLGRWYYLTDLLKPVTYQSVWLDQSGYQAVGTTAQRTAVGSLVPKGFTYYDTETAAKYRNDGAGNWSAY